MKIPVITKRVNEKFAIGFKYGPPDLEEGDKIDSCVSTVGTGLTKDGDPSVELDEVSQMISGGTLNADYTVTFQVTTSVGHIYEDKITVQIRA